MSTAFRPKADRAEWRMVFDDLTTLDVGDVITYERLDEILGRPFIDGRGPIYRATREMEKVNRRTMTAVPNVGYRVVDATEHEDLARHHHRKSRRQIRKALGKAQSADRSKLTAEQAERIDSVELSLSRQAEMIRRLDTRVGKVEGVVKNVSSKQDQSAEQIAKLTDALRRHGIEVEP